jgi:hypothetical protein
MDDPELEKEIFNRDGVLSQVEGALQIQDEQERSNAIEKLVDDRLKLLKEYSVKREFSLLSPPRKGYLHPESGVRRTFLVEPFRVDDSDVFNMLIDTFQEFKTNPGWKGRTMREIAPNAVQRTIGKYFGNHYATTSTEGRNREFYMDRSGSETDDIALVELKGKGIAVCAEKAAVAQNLLSFLGYESELVASSNCRLNTPDQDDATGHMFNIISSEDRHFIYDPANPVLDKKDDGAIHSVRPAFYPISNEQYKQLMKGGQIEVTHNDGVWDGQESHKGPDQKRIYGGPSQATLK